MVKVSKNDISLWGDPINILKHKSMTILDKILDEYESQQTTQQSTQFHDIPRETTDDEWELLNDHVNNDNLQAIYDYYDLKDRLDKEWIDGRMWHKLNPYG